MDLSSVHKVPRLVQRLVLNLAFRIDVLPLKGGSSYSTGEVKVGLYVYIVKRK